MKAQNLYTMGSFSKVIVSRKFQEFTIFQSLKMFNSNLHIKNFFIAVLQKETLSQETSRFRKRDKALFYGRKMIRKVKNISGQVRSGQGKKRKLVMKFARRILQLKKDSDQEQLKVDL